jgi:hypothetical protein
VRNGSSDVHVAQQRGLAGVRGCRCVARLMGPGAWDDGEGEGEGEGEGKIDLVWKETCIAD